ncbi:MAG: hypothetical protein ACT4NY_05290, partial [Pseudonocardiales bacterium]
RMAVALEARDFALVVSIAEGLHPELLPSATRQAAYWADYGRARPHTDRAVRHGERRRRPGRRRVGRTGLPGVCGLLPLLLGVCGQRGEVAAAHRGRDPLGRARSPVDPAGRRLSGIPRPAPDGRSALGV